MSHKKNQRSLAVNPALQEYYTFGESTWASWIVILVGSDGLEDFILPGIVFVVIGSPPI